MIRRAVITFDEAGDRVMGSFVDHLPLVVKFAPSNSSEPVEVGSNAVITGGTVYARDLPESPDVLATDRARIRGHDYEIEGEIGSWQRATGWGIQFGVKRVRG